LLFARDLSNFDALRRKAIRVVSYGGDTRAAAAREIEGQCGYAAGFAELIAHVNASLPSNEVMGEALRREVPAYPPLAVRELVANARSTKT
jgi:ATP-dependent DNA helicase RecG